jgi:antitoxin (DNA-binding transcriptional repressor) of toxin-antitoxin stability system
MWGQDGQPLAVTRSNRAVARFEPIQRVSSYPFTLFRV